MPPSTMGSRSVTFQLDNDQGTRQRKNSNTMSGGGGSVQPKQQTKTVATTSRPAKSNIKTSSTLGTSSAPFTPPTPPPPAENQSFLPPGMSTTNSYDLSATSPVSLTSDPNEAWRKHGKLYRAQLVLTDEEKGGNTFVLSSNCSIERYYKVAERVLDQFLATSINESSELTESYLVGNRLVKFLSVVLPTHSDYFSIDADLAALRNRSQAQLVELLQYMEELAMLIDEIEYNKFILKDLTPEEKNMVSEITTTNHSVGTSSFNDTTLTSVDETNTSDKENSVVSPAVSNAANKETYSPRVHDNNFSVGNTSEKRDSKLRQLDQYEQEQQSQFRRVAADNFPQLEHPASNSLDPWSMPVTTQSAKVVERAGQQRNTERRIQMQQQSSQQWDDDFAAFANERSAHSRIDLLLQDDQPSDIPFAAPSTGASSTSTPRTLAGATTTAMTTPKPFPKVKPPPSSRPRSVRRSRSRTNGNNSSETSLLSSPDRSQDFSLPKRQDPPLSHIAKLEPRINQESPQQQSKDSELGAGESSPGMRIRIADRLEEAARRQQLLIEAQRQREDQDFMQLTEWQPASGIGLFIDPASTEDSSIADGSYEAEGQKRILAQFKGCVRCLLE